MILPAAWYLEFSVLITYRGRYVTLTDLTHHMHLSAQLPKHLLGDKGARSSLVRGAKRCMVYNTNKMSIRMRRPVCPEQKSHQVRFPR